MTTKLMTPRRRRSRRARRARQREARWGYKAMQAAKAEKDVIDKWMSDIVKQHKAMTVGQIMVLNGGKIIGVVTNIARED